MAFACKKKKDSFSITYDENGCLPFLLTLVNTFVGKPA